MGYIALDGVSLIDTNDRAAESSVEQDRTAREFDLALHS